MYDEVLTFLTMMGGGIIVGLLYDLYRLLWFVKHQRSRIKHIGDLVFLIIASAFTISLLFYSNWGELRSYIYLGYFLGLIVYFKLIKGIFNHFR